MTVENLGGDAFWLAFRKVDVKRLKQLLKYVKISQTIDEYGSNCFKVQSKNRVFIFQEGEIAVNSEDCLTVFKNILRKQKLAALNG